MAYEFPRDKNMPRHIHAFGYKKDSPEDIQYFKMLTEELDQVPGRVEKWAKENGLDHFGHRDGWLSTAVVSYDNGEDPVIETFNDEYRMNCALRGQTAHPYDEDISEDEETVWKDFVFTWRKFGDDQGRFHRVYDTSWSDKEKVGSKEEAIRLVASRISSLMMRYKPSDEQLDELHSFATKHGVPYSPEVHRAFVHEFDVQHPLWMSSSAYC